MDDYQITARWYDFLVGKPLSSVFRRMTGLLTGCESVLDICCGTGLLAGIFDDANIRAVGLDKSEAMLNVAHKKHPNLPFVHGNAESLPFPNNTFAACTITFALHEKPRVMRQAILSEAMRVVRPEGRVVIADYSHPQGASRIGSWAVHMVERLAGQEHYRNFADWMRYGATEGFLDESGYTWHRHRFVLSGTAALYTIAPSR